jgi:hypothetical protein
MRQQRLVSVLIIVRGEMVLLMRREVGQMMVIKPIAGWIVGHGVCEEEVLVSLWTMSCVVAGWMFEDGWKE